MNKTYKCPSCGGQLVFDQATQKLKCPYCGFEKEIGSYEAKETHHEETNLYVCSSCGGEVIIEDAETAKSCPFCDNPIVLSSKFNQKFKPDYIVPFQMDKEDIVKAFEDHMKNQKFLPSVFKERNLLKEIKGIYVPYWVYDIDLEARMLLKAQEIKEREDKTKKYITTSFFDIDTKALCKYKELPISASLKMDETMLDSIEPFTLELKKEFSPDYLSGFYAENFDSVQSDKTKHVLKRTEKTIEDEIFKTLRHYDEVSMESFKAEITNESVKYALLPVWFLTTRFQDEEYIFAMNGTTGKLIGDLPFDKNLYTQYLLLRVMLITAIIYAFFTII